MYNQCIYFDLTNANICRKKNYPQNHLYNKVVLGIHV